MLSAWSFIAEVIFLLTPGLCSNQREHQHLFVWRWLEHKPGVRRKITSAIKDHAESTGHDVAKTDVKKGVMDQQKRLFLEAWHSVSDKESVNVHVEFPSCYLPLLKTIDIENGQYKGNSD